MAAQSLRSYTCLLKKNNQNVRSPSAAIIKEEKKRKKKNQNKEKRKKDRKKEKVLTLINALTIVTGFTMIFPFKINYLGGFFGFHVENKYWHVESKYWFFFQKSCQLKNHAKFYDFPSCGEK